MVSRIYRLVSLVALVQLAALVILVAGLLATGRLDRRKVRQMAGVLRGETLQPDQQQKNKNQETLAEPDGPPPAVVLPAALRLRQQQDAERELLVRFDRTFQEIRDRQEAVDRARLALQQRAEQFEDQKRAWARRHRDQLQKEGDQGFARVLELMENMDPEQAKKQLLIVPSQVAVRILRHMDTRKVVRIIDEFKAPEEHDALAEWLKQLRQDEALAMAMRDAQTRGHTQ